MLKRPQGPMGTEDFLQTLLEVTMSDIELVGIIELQTIMVMSRKCTLSVVKNENMNLFLIGKSSSSPCGQEVLWEARAVPQDRGLSFCFCVPVPVLLLTNTTILNSVSCSAEVCSAYFAVPSG